MIKFKIDKKWLKRSWLEFRLGHGTYLIFFLSFTQWVLIAYGYNITVQQFFKSIISFAVVFCLSYICLSIFVGKLHIKYQIDTDAKMSMRPILSAIDDVKKEVEDLKKSIEAEKG